MRDKRLILDGSICEGDIVDGVNTLEEARAHASQRERCRFFPDKCPSHDEYGGPYCIPRAAKMVAEYVVKLGSTLDAEMKDYATQARMPRRGYFDPTTEDIEQSITNRDEVVQRVKNWAVKILDIQEVDSASINNEYQQKPDAQLIERFPILTESIFDEEKSIWIHRCGKIVTVADVHRTVRDGLFPLSGPGRVVIEKWPYCAGCSAKPNTYGPDISVDEEEAKEIEILKRLRKEN